MSTRRNVWVVTGAALVLSLGLFCKTAAADDCEVKIGFVGPLTSGGSSWGLAEKAGTDFEGAWINAQGGLQVGSRKCKVTVLSYDSESTASGAAAASNYFASKGVHAVVGPIPSPEVTGWKPVAKRNGQINFATSFAVDVIGPEFPLAFHKTESPGVWGPLVAAAAKKRFNLNTVIVIGPNDQGGTDAGNAEAKIYNAAGIKASTEWYQRGTTNFAPLVARLMDMNPDAIETGPMPPSEAGLLHRQLLEADFKGTFGQMGTGSDQIMAASGGPEAQKAFYWIELVPTEDPGLVKLRTDYEQTMKSKFPENSLVYNAEIAAEQILRAISAAETDQDVEKIAATLRAMTPESRYLGKLGWRGKTMYGINQEIALPVGLGIIENGKRQPQQRLDVPSEAP
jgi:branched-chain amino acid transport system substrate-binding protein